MQLSLSNLVDLALGSSENIDCENYSLLHTVLHVMLRKLNLAESCVELGKEMVENNDLLRESLPEESSICLKEYRLKPDGGKIRKKCCRSLAPKKSLIHITSKCQKSYPQKQSHDADISTFAKTFEGIIDSLNKRIMKIESEMPSVSKDRSTNCEFTVNIRNKVEDDEDVESEISDENEENSETSWLKSKIFELSDTLKLYSNCLKKIKCEEIPKIYTTQNEIKAELLQKSTTCDITELNSMIDEVKCHSKCLQDQLLCLTKVVKNLEGNLEEHNKKTEEEMSALRLMLIDRKCDNSNDNELLVTEEIATQTDVILDPTTPNLKESKTSNKTCMNTESDSKRNFCEEFFSSSSIFCNLKATTDTTSITSNQMENCSSTTISEIKQQLSSQSICIHQLVRDVSCKIDRCEFEIFCRELNDMIDAVMQLKKDISNFPTIAAGCTIPLMKNMNCISCQASTNMAITTTALPKFPSLKFGHGRIDSQHCGDADNKVESHRKCNGIKKSLRRAGGSHTKISRRAVVTRMKYRRISTPFRCATPLAMCKNRYRKNSLCC